MAYRGIRRLRRCGGDHNFASLGTWLARGTSYPGGGCGGVGAVGRGDLSKGGVYWYNTVVVLLLRCVMAPRWLVSY